MKKQSIILIIILLLHHSISKSQELIDMVDESFRGIKSIEVTGVFCNLEFEEGLSSSVLLDGDIRAVKRYENIRIKYEQNGTLLKVWIEVVYNISGQIKGLLRFTVPKNIAVTVINTSGNISVKDIGNDTLKISSISGNISVNNIQCNAKLTSTSGSINCNNCSGNIEAKSENGNIKINNIKGDVIAESISGELNLINIVGTINALTACNSIKGSSIMITNNSYFESNSGNIEIDFLNTQKSLSFDLSSETGILEANKIENMNKLIITEGTVKITGTTFSGNQKYSCKK